MIHSLPEAYTSSRRAHAALGQWRRRRRGSSGGGGGVIGRVAPPPLGGAAAPPRPLAVQAMAAQLGLGPQRRGGAPASAHTLALLPPKQAKHV